MQIRVKLFFIVLALFFSGSIPNSFAEGDLPQERGLRGRFWVADGLAVIHSYDQTFQGNDFSLGANMEFGKETQYIFGVQLDLLGSNETSGASSYGGMHRQSLLTRFGYYFIPDHLYLSGKGGIGLVSSDTNDTASAVVYGLALGWQFSEIIPKWNVGLELAYTHTSAVNLATGIGIFYPLPAPQGTYQSANVLSLQLIVNFSLTR